MRLPKHPRRDPIEAAMEDAFAPGEYIRDSASWSFVSGLEGAVARIAPLIRDDPQRAIRLYEAFLSGCYEKAEELDDSSGSFGTLVKDVYCDWIKSRQAAKSDPDQTAALVTSRMEDDPYGFAYELHEHAVKVMNKRTLASFERVARAHFEGKAPLPEASGKKIDPKYVRRRWGEVLRAVYAGRKDVVAYAALCEATELTAADALALSNMLALTAPAEALTWIDRGIAIDKKTPYGSMAGHDLAKAKRELLKKLGRSEEALEEAWREYREHPSKFTFEELMRFVPKAAQAKWHEKAMDATGDADLGTLIELWMATEETDRLVRRLGKATDSELEDVSHYTSEPAAKMIARTHPAVAARVYRALGIRILNAKKSKYYVAALANLAEARRCYEKAGLGAEWQSLVTQVRTAHHRKAGVMAGLERMLVRSGGEEPSFIERARGKWSFRSPT